MVRKSRSSRPPNINRTHLKVSPISLCFWSYQLTIKKMYVGLFVPRSLSNSLLNALHGIGTDDGSVGTVDDGGRTTLLA